MGWPTMLVFVRHAESEGNVLTNDEKVNLDKSTHNYSLTEKGTKQASLTGEFLRKQYGVFDAYFASHYKRSKETIALLYPKMKVIEDSRLGEAQRGIFHCLTEYQIKDKYPEELLRKDREGSFHYRPLGGENCPDVELRIHSFLNTLRNDYDSKRVLVVVHNQWMALLQKILTGAGYEETMLKYKPNLFKNASVTVYKKSLSGGDKLNLEMENFTPWENKLDTK